MRDLKLYPLAILIAVGLLLGGCRQAEEQTMPAPSGTPLVLEVVREAEGVPAEGVSQDTSDEIPFAALWVSSGHADTTSEAFIHWDGDDPAVVPKTCARCHSSGGYRDFLGADGSAVGVVDADAAIGSVVSCVTCHNDATLDLDGVRFPSGAELAGLGSSAICAQCHQGRASAVQVDEAIVAKGGENPDPDSVVEGLSFVNVHYAPAAAVQAGAIAMAGYQYEGRAYDPRFAHAEGLNECVSCHNPHSLEVDPASCSSCHAGVETVEDLRSIRKEGSLADYDGDGDLAEGMYDELEGMRALLYLAMQSYADEVVGTPIVYDSHSHPYFFADTDGDGEAGADEATRDNQYNAWTPRLLRAAHNYQLVTKDRGAYAHNAKYAAQLLRDSIDDLGKGLAEPIGLDGARRDDPGHFAGSAPAFRHWDDSGVVPGTCSKCHSADGLPFLLAEGVTASQAPSNGFECSTCHSSPTDYGRYEVESVTFPSGATVDSGSSDTNLCLTCHQGRSSTASVDRVIGESGPDDVSEGLRFQNVHYYAAGATLFGAEVRGAYQYAGRSYAGRNEHVAAFSECSQCHDTHRLEVEPAECATCHEGVTTSEDLHEIRKSDTDHDGDGDTAEGIAGEIQALHARLYDAIQAYARDVAGRPIVYDSQHHPYFVVDLNANGVPDPDEGTSSNQYDAWTPRLLRAAYNYQYVAKDPGAFAHNSTYVLQVLYDSLEDLSASGAVDVTGLERAD